MNRRDFLTVSALSFSGAALGTPALKTDGSSFFIPDETGLSEPIVRDPTITTVRLEDNGAALINPGMGWMLYYYDEGIGPYGCNLGNTDIVSDFPGMAVVYFRVPWCLMEPAEGDFRWSLVDTPAQRWIDSGRRIALRFTCTESNPEYAYATPRWVQKAGAAGHFFEPGKGIVEGGKQWEPDYNDQVFLGKLENFVAAAAQRYDGDPNVAIVDVGSFGVWGEGHNFFSSKLPYDAETVCRHIDLYRRHFRRTLLAANDDMSDHGRGVTVLEYAREQGLTLRDDSILVQGGTDAYFSAGLAQAFWPQRPVILETEHYGSSRESGHWRDGARYLDAVEDYHASYASIHGWPREFLNENKDLVRRINARLGYRIQLPELSWPSRIGVNAEEAFSFAVRNAGVAPMYESEFISFTLKDRMGGIAAVFTDERIDLRMLPPGPPGAAEAFDGNARVHLPPYIPRGTYQVLVSAGSRSGTPRIQLPLDGDDGRKRYLVGAVMVESDEKTNCRQDNAG
jgi:hypothetical protein